MINIGEQQKGGQENGEPTAGYRISNGGNVTIY